MFFIFLHHYVASSMGNGGKLWKNPRKITKSENLTDIRATWSMIELQNIVKHTHTYKHHILLGILRMY